MTVFEIEDAKIRELKEMCRDKTCKDCVFFENKTGYVYTCGKADENGRLPLEKDYKMKREVKTDCTENNVVNNPTHYNRESAMECIDEMLVVFGEKAVMDFCLLNIWKYRYRAGQKDTESAMKDLKKSDWYMNKYKELRGV